MASLPIAWHVHVTMMQDTRHSQKLNLGRVSRAPTGTPVAHPSGYSLLIT